MGKSQSSESQTSACFFDFPLEIRRAIYDDLIPPCCIHLVRNKYGAIRLTRCFDPDLYDHDMGLERRAFSYPCYEDRVWQDRLRSRWGPHWRCEEEARTKAWVEPLLTVCRDTRLEFAQMLGEKTHWQVATLQDMAALNQPHPDFSLANLILPHAIHLSVAFFLPFHFFLELQGASWLFLGHKPPEDIMALVPLWREFPTVLTDKFRRLVHLRVWIDHDEPNFWTNSNERVFLESIKPVLTRGADQNDSRIGLHNVFLVLPRRTLMEDAAQTEWDFDPQPRVETNRVLRQRYRVSQRADGKTVVYYEEEYPDVEGHPVLMASLKTISEIEASEARMWD